MSEKRSERAVHIWGAVISILLGVLVAISSGGHEDRKELASINTAILQATKAGNLVIGDYVSPRIVEVDAALKAGNVGFAVEAVRVIGEIAARYPAARALYEGVQLQVAALAPETIDPGATPLAYVADRNDRPDGQYTATAKTVRGYLVLFRGGDPATAAPLFEEALLLGGVHEASARIGLGMALLGEKKTRVEGLAFLKEGLQIDKSHSVGLEARAKAAYADGEMDLAVEFSKMALARNMTTNSLAVLSLASLKNGDYNTAKNVARRIVSTAPRIPDGYRILGQIALEEKDVDGAIEQLTQAAKLSGMAGDLSQLAQAQRKAGKFKDALTTLDKLRKQNPDDIDSLVAMAEILEEAGSLHNALSAWNTLASLTVPKKHPQAAALKAVAANASARARVVEHNIRTSARDDQ